MGFKFRIYGDLDVDTIEEADSVLDSWWDILEFETSVEVKAILLEEPDAEAELGSDQLHDRLDHQPFGNV